MMRYGMPLYRSIHSMSGQRVFNVDLEWTTSGDLSVSGGSGASAASRSEVSFFTALQEQLGLKLEPSRAPFEVTVVDDITRPTPD